MSTITQRPKLLFVINPGSGNNTTDYEAEIDRFFAERPEVEVTKHVLDEQADCKQLQQEIESLQPDAVIATGGDGTIKMVAELLLGTDTPMGILPAGSANGMAKELHIPIEPEQALLRILEGKAQRIHLVRINEELCIHLSDIGFNAAVVKAFDQLDHRGMLGYMKAAWQVLWRHSRMKAVFSINGRTVEREAVMVVIANATSYGTGIRINPEGKLDDDLFEVVIVRKISFTELFKMGFLKIPFNPGKTEVFQTQSLLIRSRKSVHFQVDGEYLGKVKEIKAELLPQAISIIY